MISEATASTATTLAATATSGRLSPTRRAATLPTTSASTALVRAGTATASAGSPSAPSQNKKGALCPPRAKRRLEGLH